MSYSVSVSYSDESSSSSSSSFALPCSNILSKDTCRTGAPAIGEDLAVFMAGSELVFLNGRIGGAGGLGDSFAFVGAVAFARFCFRESELSLLLLLEEDESELEDDSLPFDFPLFGEIGGLSSPFFDGCVGGGRIGSSFFFCSISLAAAFRAMIFDKSSVLSVELLDDSSSFVKGGVRGILTVNLLAGTDRRRGDGDATFGDGFGGAELRFAGEGGTGGLTSLHDDELDSDSCVLPLLTLLFEDARRVVLFFDDSRLLVVLFTDGGFLGVPGSPFRS